MNLFVILKSKMSLSCSSSNNLKFIFVIAWLCVMLAGRGYAVSYADYTLTDLGKAPLTDGVGAYQGYELGLYSGNSNQPPQSHYNAAMNVAGAIVPLDTMGRPSTDPNYSGNGKIVLLSVGISNTTHEFAMGSNAATNPATKTVNTFKSQAGKSNSGKSSSVVIYDGAQAGQDITNWTNAVLSTQTGFTTWGNIIDSITGQLKDPLVSGQLTSETAQQVQAVWLKHSRLGSPMVGPFPYHAQVHRDLIEIVARNIKTLFPNCKIIYCSSRTRAYTVYSASPEPNTYEEGFAVKWAIEDQINGTSAFNYNNAPVLLWGPYLWTEGAISRTDGLQWLCDGTSADTDGTGALDVYTDGLHPGMTGVQKVANQLLAFFKTHPTTTSWFLDPSKNNPNGNLSGVALSIGGGVTTGSVPWTVNFTATGGSSGMQYVWNYEDGTHSLKTHPATTVTKTFKVPGVYNVRMTATDSSGNYIARVLAVTVLPPSGSPTTPTNLAASLPTIPSTPPPSNPKQIWQPYDQINLSWTDSSNETGFRIERKKSTDPVTSYTEIAVVPANITGYMDRGLSGSTAYDYRIRATNTTGDSIYSNVASKITLTVAPKEPSNLIASEVSSTQIDLNWTDHSNNESQFRIDRRVVGSGYGFSPRANPPADSTSFSDKTVVPGVQYEYRVRALRNVVNNVAYESQNSNIVTSPNLAPVVDAGTSQNIDFGVGVNLDGTVTDDGLPLGNSLTTIWNVQSGPGGVIFGDIYAVDTTASFSQPGVYTLVLTANDGTLSSSDTMSVYVNAAPVVGTGADQTVVFGTVVSLDGTVTDDGLPLGNTLDFTWIASGPGSVQFNPNNKAEDVTASFSKAGVYVLTLTASDGALSSNDTVTVTVELITGAIAGGLNHSVAIDHNGNVYTCGRDDYGQQGNGSASSANVIVPTTIGLGNIDQVSAGLNHTLALNTQTGAVWTWGRNTNGQCGNNSIVNISAPAQMDLANISANGGQTIRIAGGGAFTVAMDSNGKVFTCGANWSGQQATGTTGGSNRLKLAITTVLTSGFTEISAGFEHGVALKNDGTVYAWGNNVYGSVGNGTGGANNFKPTPLQVFSGANPVLATAVGAGEYHTLAVDASDGSVWAWGRNTDGQLGKSSLNKADSWVPVKVNNLQNIVAVYGGSGWSMALDSSAQVWVWGKNSLGQLGIGNTTMQLSPVMVGVLNGSVGLSAGSSHGIALGLDGVVQAWGDNSYGKLGLGTTGGSVTTPQTNGLDLF